ncbi:MAG: hypothetical protein AAB914_02290 [Patescibacteria group bacterium]
MRRPRIKSIALDKLLKPKIAVLFLTFILVGSIAIGVIYRYTKHAAPVKKVEMVDCATLADNWQIGESNTKQQIYDELKNNLTRCTGNQINDLNSKAKVITYYAAIANIALANEDKKQAYEYIDQAVKQYQTLSSEDKKKIENISRIENDILNVLGQQSADESRVGGTQ